MDKQQRPARAAGIRRRRRRSNQLGLKIGSLEIQVSRIGSILLGLVLLVGIVSALSDNMTSTLSAILREVLPGLEDNPGKFYTYLLGFIILSYTLIVLLFIAGRRNTKIGRMTIEFSPTKRSLHEESGSREQADQISHVNDLYKQGKITSEQFLDLVRRYV
jgi:hypothetical protein